MPKTSRVLHLIAHNIRSAENIGSLFRTCDSLGIAKLWITGYSPSVDHPRVEKTALGAERIIDWAQEVDVVQLITRLKEDGFRIIGLELDRRSVDLLEYRGPDRIALLLGNEVEGITPTLLDLCDDVVSIKQQGKKESLNVAVAAAITSFWILNCP